mgnify:CR=1 FL=1
MVGEYIVMISLAIVQGIAEFLPISSSGHLVLMQQTAYFQGYIASLGADAELFLSVMLHLATLIAVIIFLWHDIISLLVGACAGVKEKKYSRNEIKTIGYIIVASFPAGIAGIAFHDFFEGFFTSAVPVFFLLIINGFILLSTKIIAPGGRKIEETGVIRSIVVGCAQACAILPGISRSGTTITAGMLCGIAPVESARFSFLMAIPVIAGAAAIELAKIGIHAFPVDIIAPLIVSMVIALCVALASLKLLFVLVKQIRIDVFGYYTIALGLAGLLFHYL